MDLESILDRFLLDFDLQLGGARGSNERAFRDLVGSWRQDGPKTPPRAILDRFFGPHSLHKTPKMSQEPPNLEPKESLDLLTWSQNGPLTLQVATSSQANQ